LSDYGKPLYSDLQYCKRFAKLVNHLNKKSILIGKNEKRNYKKFLKKEKMKVEIIMIA